MSPAIRIENLSKRYVVSHEGKPRGYQTLRESLMDMASAPLRRLRGVSADTTEDFWALNDVNVEIKQGEIVGIIGRNGAGKSTLLKILSRITKPTKGRVTLNGRIGSLLEVGTGFHPELTGRENVFLNGSILGMSRQEVTRKFDEIVSFAEVEKFLDTPVKRYSSGMYVRLAFAVAAHLEPEILLVDEVLAVGDVQFQNKCLGKMESVAENGRTVIFVSHQMSTVRRLCKKAVVMSQGRVLQYSGVDEAVDTYLKEMEKSSSVRNQFKRNSLTKSTPYITEVKVRRDEGSPEKVLVAGDRACFGFSFSAPVSNPHVVFTVYDMAGIPAVNFDTRRQKSQEFTERSLSSLQCEIPELLLRPGRYRVNTALYQGANCIEHVEAVTSFEVEGGCIRDTIVENGSSFGAVVIPHNWNAI